MNKTGSPTFSASALSPPPTKPLSVHLYLGEIAQTAQPGPGGGKCTLPEHKDTLLLWVNGNQVRSSFFNIFYVCLIRLWETLLSSSQELVPPPQRSVIHS